MTVKTQGDLNPPQKGATLIPFTGEDEEQTSANEEFFKEPFEPSEFDLPDGPFLRFQAYRKSWHKCLERIKEIIRALRRPVVEEILEIVESSHFEGIALPAPELLTILLSSSDRFFVQGCLSDILIGLRRPDGADKVPSVIVSQVTVADGASLINIMKAIISEFIYHPLTPATAIKLRSTSSLAGYDIKLLHPWYNALRERFGDDVPRLLILIQDVSCIEMHTMKDLLEICSYQIPEIPLVFLMGSTDINYLQDILPRSTLSHLRVESRNLSSDKDTLEHIIKETFFSMDFFPDIMLGPKGLDLVFNNFQRHNASLDGLVSILHLLHIHHFYNPLSILVNPEYDSPLHEILRSNQDWKPFMKLLRQRSISGDMDDEGWQVLSPEKVLEDAIAARETFRTCIVGASTAARLIAIITAYGRGRLSKLPDISFWEIASIVFGSGESMELESKVREMCDILRDSKAAQVSALLDEIYQFVNHVPVVARSFVKNIKRQLVQTLNGTMSTAEFIAYLSEDLCEKMRSFEDILCQDIWWAGDSIIPNSPFNPNSHVSIVTSLLEPHKYLGLDTEKETRKLVLDACILFRRYLESGRMINIYDWYQSFSVTIDEDGTHSEEDMDVYETPTKPKRNKTPQHASLRRRRRGRPAKRVKAQLPKIVKTLKRTEKERMREVQARFLRAMSELEFVGFLKHTSRKSEHVLKTVFDLLD